jgi:hypothetical protein
MFIRIKYTVAPAKAVIATAKSTRGRRIIFVRIVFNLLKSPRLADIEKPSSAEPRDVRLIHQSANLSLQEATTTGSKYPEDAPVFHKLTLHTFFIGFFLAGVNVVQYSFLSAIGALHQTYPNRAEA